MENHQSNTFWVPADAIYKGINSDKNALDQQMLPLVIAGRLIAGLSTIADTVTHYTHDVDKSADDILKKLQECGYTTTPLTSGNTRFGAFLQDVDCQCVKVFIRISTLATDVVTVHFLGDEEAVNDIKNLLKNDFSDKGAFIRTATHIDKNGIVAFDDTFLDASTIETARQCFYPWLGISLEAYFDAFMASSESILIMFGPPGTGKSTFLRTLINYKQLRVMLAYNKDVVESPALINNFYRNKRTTVLAYEDLDVQLGSREDGNTLMSTLLNASEGVVKQAGKKIILSTNLNSIDKIDPALLRKGRCFDILHFNLLTRDEANNVITEMKLPFRDLSEKAKWALAEILNPPVPEQQTINRFSRNVGF